MKWVFQRQFNSIPLPPLPHRYNSTTAKTAMIHYLIGRPLHPLSIGVSRSTSINNLSMKRKTWSHELSDNESLNFQHWKFGIGPLSQMQAFTEKVNDLADVIHQDHMHIIDGIEAVLHCPASRSRRQLPINK